jgi:DNA-binding NtrC family response regulator
MEVLLFDCRNDQLVMMEEILTRIGCKVASVMREHECVAKLISGRYDLVIFDHAIPGLDVTAFVTQIETIDCCMSVAMKADFMRINTAAQELISLFLSHSGIMKFCGW